MFSFTRNITNVFSCLSHHVKKLCTNVSKFDSTFFSKDSRILDTLNKCSPQELSKYKISTNRAESIVERRTTKGPFKSLNDLLEVKGMGAKILQQICMNISSHKLEETPPETQNVKPKFRRDKKYNLLTPDVPFSLLNDLKNAVAIHIDQTGVGWAKLEAAENSLTNWSHETFTYLPEKMMPVDNFHLALNILRKTPPADVYIYEATNNPVIQNSKQATVTAFNQQAELASMLLALLNTSVIHNASLKKLNSEEPLKPIDNRVFYLRSYIPARLFKTLIGSERVSADVAIENLLKNNIEKLPCTPINFLNGTKQFYLKQNAANKELLAQALMLGVSFMDLYVRKNPISREALSANRPEKKDKKIRD